MESGAGGGSGMSPGVGDVLVKSPAGRAESATSSVAGIKRDADPEAEGELGDDSEPNRKKKKTGPGSRGVANLTADQLAKKRANDREAQRAIRERTKNQIDALERRIHELTSQQPYQELQAVIRAREAVEQENAEIKRRLASIVGVLQSIIGPGAAEHAYISPQAYGPSASAHTHSRNTGAGPTGAPTPPVATPPVGNPEHRHLSHGWQPEQGEHSTGNTPGYDTQHSSEHHGEHHGEYSGQQRIGTRRSVDIRPERLELDFLLQPNQRANKILNGNSGAQDTPRFHHVPMKHDWTAITNGQPSHARSHASDSPGRMEGHMSGHNDGRRDDGSNTSHPRSPGQGYPSGYHGTGPEGSTTPAFARPVKNCAATCPLDSLLLDFLCERHQRVAEGLPAHEVVGPGYPSVSSLLNPATSAYSHPLSKVFTDILATFPDISKLPERVAVLYIMFLVMRWQVSPTRENYERLPEWMAPSYLQLNHAHPAWIDHLPFPLMRDTIIRLYNPEEYLFDNFFIPFTTTLRLSWPYEEIDTLLQSPDSEELMINPVFERHLRNLDNWKLGDAFVRAFPSLAETGNFDTGGPQRGGARASGTPRSEDSPAHSR